MFLQRDAGKDEVGVVCLMARISHCSGLYSFHETREKHKKLLLVNLGFDRDFGQNEL